ncbi:hypothetical protein [Bacteroides sp.]
MRTNTSKLDGEMYNKEMAKLEKIIDLLNDALWQFCAWQKGYDVPDFLNRLINSPAETFHRYLSYEFIAQEKCNGFDVGEDEYNNPNYQICYEEITSEMVPILEAHNELCRLLPDIKEAYSNSLFRIEINAYGDRKVVKTADADLYIMKQCTEYI